MIRLNAFFQVKTDGDKLKAIELGNELVAESLKDNGCVSYGLFTSTTRHDVLMFCETWTDQASLAAHMDSTHFKRIVPLIEALTANGMKLEKFEF
ncbi:MULTISPECIES: putative quinol monooxygenase [Muribaculum]|jgi:quinol monooxygenase YgiN|uniref:Antibiotic biosynthesis monooxygenase n=2 Tax=Muribaculum TaxID=1918540 RepID=A0AC61S5H5_9BACT|nr:MULTISPECIES: putative quinol monooxygenase [Muribaculum]THG51874.1 antibiotic biosynthesis monooxygenase [Muribaculum caecicola]